MTDSLMEVVRRNRASASLVNPDSPSRLVLRALMRWNELEVADALLCLDKVAHMDDRCDEAALRAVVGEARAVLQPLWEPKP